ncbi:MAG: tetratricopeptide repeat protein, partial [Bdellovibrionales bacterium]|nr:tetratricopeptide repeat protein [Bdellovibrionales bacterium]
ESEKLLKRVVSREPSSQNLTSLAWSQIEQEKYQAAKRNLDKAIRADSENGLAYNNLGVLYQRMGETKKAKQAFTYATRRDPNNKMFQSNLEQLLSD